MSFRLVLAIFRFDAFWRLVALPKIRFGSFWCALIGIFGNTFKNDILGATTTLICTPQELLAYDFPSVQCS